MEVPVSIYQQQFLDFSLSETGFRKKVHAAYDVQGDFDLESMLRAFDHVVRSEPACRLRLRLRDGEYWQRFQSGGIDDRSLLLHRLPPGTSSVEFERYVANLIVNVSAEDWDPFEGPAVQLTVVERTPSHHVVVFFVSHLSADTRGLVVLTRRVFAIYDHLVKRISLPEVVEEDAGLRSYLSASSSHRIIASRRPEEKVEHWSRVFSLESSFEGVQRVLRDPATGVPELVSFDLTGAEFSTLVEAAKSVGVSDCQWFLWKIEEFLVTEVGLPGCVICLSNDFRSLAERDIVGLFSGHSPLQLPGLTCKVEAAQERLFQSIFTGLLAPRALRSCFPEGCGYDLRWLMTGPLILFSHFETSSADGPLSSVLDVKGDAFSIPLNRYGAEVLGVHISTYDDRYSLRIHSNSGTVRAAGLEHLEGWLRGQLAR